MKYNKSDICKAANELVNKGHGRPDAFRQAWALAKNIISSVAGVSFGKRPAALAKLSSYRPEQINVQLVRDSGNGYDGSAIAVIVTVEGKGAYQVGYVPAKISKVLAPIMDMGAVVRATFKSVVGGWLEGQKYGMRIALAI